MGATGKEFLLMRMNEETQEYFVPTMSKKDIVTKAKDDAEAIMNEGDKDTASVYMDAVRMSEYLAEFAKVLKSNITEDEYGKTYDVKGATISFRNSGDRLDYASDLVYAKLQEKLKEREALLKLAFKSKDMIFDSEGVEVQKVHIKTFGTDSVVVKF